MNTFILLPSGDAVSNAVIKSVRYVPGRGVSCSDAQRRLVVWIEVADVEKGHQSPRHLDQVCSRPSRNPPARLVVLRR